MYMPQQVQVVYGAKYTDTEIGAGAELANDIYANIMSGKSSKEVVKSSSSFVSSLSFPPKYS